MKTATLGWLFAVWSLASAGECSSWSRAKSGSFEIVTEGDATSARQLLELLVKANAVIRTRLAPTKAERSLRVLVFSSDEEFHRWAPDGLAAAYFLPGNRRNLIVMKGEIANRNTVALHELTHHVLDRTGWRLRPWLKEGLAEYYSTLTVGPEGARIGGMSLGRAASLQRADRLPISVLLDTDRLNGLVQDRSFLLRFYAQSGALAAMLLSDPGYRGETHEFLQQAALNGAAAAFRSVYRKDLMAIESDLASFLCQAYGPENVVEQSAPTKVSATVDVRTLSCFRVDAILAELAIDQSWSRGLVEARLRRLTVFPENKGEVARLWGDWKWQTHDGPGSRIEYLRAVDGGIHDAKTLLRLAQLEQESGAPISRVRQLLARILEVRPQHDEARRKLALLEFNAGNYRSAIQAMAGLQKLRPEWSWRYYFMLAYEGQRQNHPEEAIRYAQLAASEARDEEETSKTQRLLQQIVSSNHAYATLQKRGKTKRWLP